MSGVTALWVLWAVIALPFDLEPMYAFHSETECRTMAVLSEVRIRERVPNAPKDIFRCTPILVSPPIR